MPLDGRHLRSESQRLDACSVGLRRSEIDGYFQANAQQRQGFAMSQKAKALFATQQLEICARI